MLVNRMVRLHRALVARVAAAFGLGDAAHVNPPFRHAPVPWHHTRPWPAHTARRPRVLVRWQERIGGSLR